MFTEDSLLLTTAGYRFLRDIDEPVQVISEYSRDGWAHVVETTATVEPRSIPQRAVSLITQNGRRIKGDYASLFFLASPLLQKPYRRGFYKGEWKPWQDIVENEDKIAMSRESTRGEVTIDADDWAFYSYGYNDNEDEPFPLPIPQATEQDVSYKPYAARRQELPEWYWECTLGEKILFLRGLWDRHGRIADQRVMIACPTITFAEQLVLAHSEFGIRGIRYTIPMPNPKTVEGPQYMFDIRNGESLKRLANNVCWIEDAMPSWRFQAIHRQSRKNVFIRAQPPTTHLLVNQKNLGKLTLYRVAVDGTHNCVINGLAVRDSEDRA